jgi:hypothetical protein
VVFEGQGSIRLVVAELCFQVIGLIVLLLLKDRAKDGQPPKPPAPHEWFG